jgi:hypothetical protein
VPLIDERGRVFGRFNLIDAIVALFVVALIPLAYGAYLLFRPDPPQIVTIEPTRIQEHERATLRVTGSALRPFLMVKFGEKATGFLVESPTHGEINVPDLGAGTYDLILIDRGQPLLRKPAALTVVPPPPPAVPSEPDPSTVIEVQAVGRFLGLHREAANGLRRGEQLRLASTASDKPPVAEILALRAPQPEAQRIRTGQNRFIIAPSSTKYQVAAVVRLRCAVANGECKVNGTTIAENATLMLVGQSQAVDARPSATRGDDSRSATAQPVDPVSFVVEDVRPGDNVPSLPPASMNAWATLRVRFNATPELLARLHPGEVDVPGQQAFDAGNRAVLTAIGSDRRPVTLRSTTSGVQFEEEGVRFTGTVRVPVTFLGAGATTSASWMYKGQVVRTGLPFTFEMPSDQLPGFPAAMRIEQRPNR